MEVYYDLHAHTTASDGTFSPKELVELAKIKGLAGVGITDHDTTDGIEEALEHARKIGIEIVPGVEINTEYEGCEVHVLGYYFDRFSTSLQELFHTLRGERINRMEKILELLRKQGIMIQKEEVFLETGDGSVGRPHIARILIKKGLAENMRDAFNKYLGKGAVAYVERYKLSPADAIRKIRESKGVPILAHPGLVGKDGLIEELLPAGLLGIEAAHPDHSQEERSKYKRLAASLGILATGGSDFHGSGAEHRGDLGSVVVPSIVVQNMREQSGLF